MKCWTLIEKALRRDGRCAMVSIVAAEGSVPRETGARMIVTNEGFHGTIGGGSLEWQAIAAAQAMLAGGAASRLASYSLGPDLGQCCGGRVKLATEVFDRNSLGEVEALAAREAQGAFELTRRVAGIDVTERHGDDARRLYLFGAGHVGRALVLALAALPFDIVWCDARPNAFPGAVPANVTLAQVADPAALLADAPRGSLAWVMSHSHALDLAIVDAALRHSNIAHVGLIGSATKRARFEKRLREAGVAAERIAGLFCPIGIDGIRGKHPAIIAASAAAQLVVLHEALAASEARASAPMAEEARSA